ncbi:MAG: cell surface protein SprA [Fidelibacterota bacterium]
MLAALLLVPAAGQDSAGDGEAALFPLRVDWLSNRFASLKMETPRGLSLLSPYAHQTNRFILNVYDPRQLKTETRLDDTGQHLIFIEEYKGLPTRAPRGISLDSYFQQKSAHLLRNELHEICRKSFVEPKSAVRSEKLELIGADIAGQRVALRVSGNVNINGRLQNQKQSQVRTGYNAGSSTTFIVDQKQQLNIEGKIGDRISILVDQDSERDFDFENNLKIIYTGEEDDIVQKVEAGNISLSLPGTQFVTFSGTNNGLFGFKALMKLGAIDITTIASVEKGKKEKLSVDGGAQKTSLAIKDYEYVKRQYFFLDDKFRDSFYDGFLESGGVFKLSGRTVVDLEVYKSITGEIAGSISGKAFVDPNFPDQDTSYTEKRVFQRLVVDEDYSANLDLGFIRLRTPAQESEIIAVVYRVLDPGKNPIEEYGDWDKKDSSDIQLKMIKPRQNRPSHPCWDLEFKNVYYLGTTGINSEGFELDIVYIYGKTGDVERDPVDGVPFIQKFGLDLKAESGDLTPDGIVDTGNPNVLSLQSGELWLPFLRPFQYDSTGSGVGNENLNSDYNCSAMYESNRTNITDITQDSKFKIICKYENRSSVINLGAMVIEGSESVMLSGQTLTRGVDYTIDYFTGTLTLINPEATKPNAELDIKYERNQFFQLDKKTILGARAQYDFGDNSFIGGTALYFSQSVVDEKVDVGYEPMRNFVWDLNGRLNQNLNFLTRAVNWLPLIETDKPSSITIEGEIAQVRPNPNTLSNEETGDPNGVGFIDDFEGSKRITSPPIIYRYWSHAAAPLSKRDSQRGFFFWYNPYGGVATKKIWPNKQVSTQAQNNLTEIMVMVLDPYWSIEVVDGFSQPEEAWGGITYAFPTSYYDQSKTKFLEVWVRGTAGRMHIDLGYISEDYIQNGELDTEDQPEAGFTLGNDLLDDGEDTGIDGVFDEDEFIVNCLGDTIRYGSDSLTFYNRSKTDPHSDNWKWSEGSRDYRHINGTENSSEGDATGYVPDSEDLNRDFEVNLVNDYYTIDFLLDDRIDENYVAGRTEFDNGSPTGWKLYRIPLNEFQKAKPNGDVSWQTIEACRVWIDGVTSEDTVMIAKIELVGNEWEELGIGDGTDGNYVKNDEAFSISVLNTEDNPVTYDPPEGVRGEYDAVNEIQLKEQSLVMSFNNNRGLRPGEAAAAKKVLFEDASFITYKKMKLFVAGHELRTRTKFFDEGEKTPLQFFIKFGIINDENKIYNYYEYRQPVYPGWDKKNNMEIDFDFLTSLKGFATEEDFSEHYPNDSGLQPFTITHDGEGGVLKRHWREIKDGRFTGKEIIIVGSPTISKVKRIDMGVINQKYTLEDVDRSSPLPRYDNTVFGEVWLDELRLSDVRRDPGIAYRGSVALTVADLGRVNVNIDQRDADFHTVEQRPNLQTTGLNNTRNLSVRGNINLDKLTPANWGLSLPVSGSYTNRFSAPKFLPNSDILAGDAPPDSVLNLSESYGVNVSYSKRSSDFWLTKYTIDQLRVSVSAQWSNSSSVTDRRNESENYRGSISYKVPFGRNNFLQPFKWAQNIPVLGSRLGDLRWYYTPSNLDFSVDAAESKSTKIPRKGKITEPYDLGLNRSITAGYKVFDNLNLNYSWKAKNSLTDFRDDKLKAIRELNPGRQVNVNESYSANFNPKIFSWLTPSISYSAAYTWGEPVTSGTRSVDNLSNQNRISTSFSLDPSAIMKTFYTPKSARKSATRPAGTGRTTGRGRHQTTEPERKDEIKEDMNKAPKEIPLLEYLYSAFNRVQPIQFSYSTSRSNNNKGRVGEPGLLYRMGLASDPGLDTIATEAGVYPNSISINSDASLRSGIKITNNINTSLSYSQNMSWSKSQGNFNRNLTRDYITFDNSGKEGIPFPGWTLSISQLEKIKFLSKVFTKLSLDHGFTGKESVVYRNGEIQNSSYKLYFQPLVGLSMQFKNNISSSLRVSGGKSITNQPNGGASLVTDQSINASMNYQKKGGFTIPLPFLKNKRLENNINFTMAFDYSSSKTEQRNDAVSDFKPTNSNTTWKIEPRISYSFTQKVTGGIFFSYSESKNARTGKRITRNGGFDVNIAIRG